MKTHYSLIRGDTNNDIQDMSDNEVAVNQFDTIDPLKDFGIQDEKDDINRNNH